MLRKLYMCGLMLSILVCSLPAAAQQNRNLTRDNDTQKRLALIIGNGNYLNARKLANPVNDAIDMTSTLRELGFEVISGTNLNLRQMTEKVREFGDKLRASGGVGLFYYAGHGVQVNGRNYLIPVEADIPREDEITYVALNLELVLQKMATANNGLNIVVLDACRNNPFARGWSRDTSDGGLAQITTPKGTFIAYATSPDTTASDGTGRNGLYTAELLKYIKQPNLKIEEIFKEVTKAVDDKSAGKQTPWFSSSLRGEFVFKPNQKTASVTKPIFTENSVSISPPVAEDSPPKFVSVKKPVPDNPPKQNEVTIPGSLGAGEYYSYAPIEVLFKKGFPGRETVRSAVVDGSLSEIKDKRKVYVSAFYSKVLLDSKDDSSEKIIVDRLAKYGGVEIVENPETADFIIHYSGEESELFPISPLTIRGDMIVVTREQSSGVSDKARILWKDKETQRYDGGTGVVSLMKRHPAESMTRHFIAALKKARGEK